MAAKHPGSEKPSNDADKGGRANWRGKGRAAATTSRFSWQQNPNDSRKREVVRKNLRRRMKLAGSAVVLASLLAAFGAYMFWRAPATPLFAAAITRYAAPLPPNAWAAEDQQRIEALAALSPSSGWYDSRGPLRVTARDKQWDSPEAALEDVEGWLEEARPGGPGKDAVLIYLSAHGVVDGEGRSCLILADSKGGDIESTSPHLDSTRWLPVRDLVMRLHKWRPEVNKLLLLDASRMESNWNIGLLYNGFAEGLDDAVREAPSVAILNSAGPGEIGWAAPELQGSAFGFFVCQGLAGDPRADTDGNGWISLQELRSYVKGRMGDWVSRRRFDVQSPLLVPANREFKLVWTRSSSTAAFDAPAGEALQDYFKSSEPVWAEIGELWREHARLRSPGESSSSPVWREHCRLWHEFSQGLVRCEQLALAGPAYRTDAEDALEKLREQARELAEREQEKFPMHSLPLAQAWRAWPDQGDIWRKSIMNSFDRPAQPPGPEARSRYLVRADAAWRWLVEGDAETAQVRLQPESIRRILDFVGRPDAPQQAELAELHFLRLLAGDAKAPGGSNLPPTVWEQAGRHVLKALAARQAAELAAAPADERARYAIGTLVAAGDGHLRRAEDALFVARKSDLDQAELFRQQALASYQQAQAKAERLTAAFAARDRAWTDLPYLAQWFARRFGSKAAALDSAAASDDLLRSTVRAIGRAHDLDELLEQYLADCLRPGESNVPAPAEMTELEDALEATSRQLAVSLDGLAGALAQAVKQVMEQQTSDERTLRDIGSLLSSPLVSGEQRLSLRERYKDELVLGIAGSEGEAVAWETEVAALDQDGPFLQRILAWPEHPALAILGRDETPEKEKPAPKARDEQPGEGAWRRLARQGDDVRRLLGPPLQGTPANAGSAEGEAFGSLLSGARSALSRAERRLVAGAALGAAAGSGGDDPIRRLLQFDRSELLAWQANRRLDDFWGSDDAMRRKTFYFVAAFEDCSRAAPALDSFQVKHWHDLTLACDDRKQAAEKLVFPPDSKDQPRMRRETLEKTISLKLASPFPQGTAALYVADALQQPTVIREKAATEAAFDARLPSLVGGADGAIQVAALLRRTGAPSDLPAGKPWDEVWFYRGHRHTSEFYVRPMGKGIELVYRRPPPGPATVTVSGEAKRPGSVVFILDCSGSMVKNDRMKKAKNALSNILGQLAVTGQYQVGLWFYGHRAGVDADGKAVAFDWGDAARKRWWGEPLPSLLPSDDLQRIVSLAPLDRQSVKDVQEAVATAWPYGRTPLYRAIVEVVNEDLARQPRDLPRRLVVITDGQNEVTAAGDRWSPRKGSLVDEEDVKQCFAGEQRNNPQRRIQLDILGVEVPNKRSLETMLGDDRIRGKYYDVGRAEELEHVLENALGLYKYSVARIPRDGAEEPLGEKTLGETFEIDQRDDVKERYRVRLVGTTPAAKCELDLQSREAIALAVSQASGQWRLRHEPYQRGQQTEETAVSPHTLNPGAAPGSVDADFNPAEFYVAAHRPEIRPGTAQPGKTVAFPISFQNADRERFSPRPVEAWVEIAPVFAASQPAGEPYRVFDLSFEPQRPVPVLDCITPDWPAEARNAQIRVWFKLTRTKPSKEVSIAELETEPGELRKLNLPGAPDAQFGLQFEELADGCQLAVDEEHPLESPTAEWVRVEPRTPPDEIRRIYNHEGRFARHLFLFRGKSLSQIRGDKLQLTSQRDLQAGAAAVTEPLRVTIHD